MSIYIPKMYYKDIYCVNYDRLKEKKIKYLIFDLDNTLGLINDKVCNLKTKNLLNELKKEFKIIIASNNNFERVKTFIDNLDVDIIAFALKPSSKIYRYVKKNYTKNMNEVAIIGDQIVTDIIAGNRFKILSILVDPKGEKDLKITGLNRLIEKYLMKKIKFQRGEYYEEK